MLKRVVGTTCASPTGFDTAPNSFAYIAGGAVVVADVDGQACTQRFFRARPTTVPLLASSAYSPSAPTPVPKANDSRNRAPIPRDSAYGASDWSDSKTTWTSRERIKAATCLALSRDGRFLAVGETGYAPRVLIFSLEDSSSDTPLVSISEHTYGVNAVAWSPDTRFLASLGAANDGYLYLWRIDPRTGAAKLFQQNRCTSFIRGMIWMGNSVITLGVRHAKVWRIEEASPSSPLKQRFQGEAASSPSQQQKSLPGRNILLGGLLDATFTCATAVDDTRAIICSEAGDVCLFDDTAKQMKLTKVLDLGFVTTCITVRNQVVYVGSKTGTFTTLDLARLLECDAECVLEATSSSTGLSALGFLKDNLVTVDAQHSIDIWNASYVPGREETVVERTQLPGHEDGILGVKVISQPNPADAAFYTWSGNGTVVLWDMHGQAKDFFRVTVDEAQLENESQPMNQLSVVQATPGGHYFVTGDKLGVLRVVEYATKVCVFATKAHTSNCQSIATYVDGARFLIASSARDRTTQLFHRTSGGKFELFQTLEFAAKVVQVMIPSAERVITCSLDRSLQIHELISRDGEPEVMAAVTARSLSLKASPTSLAVDQSGKHIYVSLLDKTLCVYNSMTGKISNTFRCIDEAGSELVVLDSLVHCPATEQEPATLLGLSNTDKSIRLYDAQNGNFLAREWGHTEAINGVALVQEEDGGRKVVSVGSDGAIMMFSLELGEQIVGSISRDSSPMKEACTSARPPLRRVRSKAELAEFQRPSSSSQRPSSSSLAAGRNSPPRALAKRRSHNNLITTPAKMPVGGRQSSPSSVVGDGAPLRRPSSGSPPSSPKGRALGRRTSVSERRTSGSDRRASVSGRRPSLSGGATAPAKSPPSTRTYGSLNTATEQATRTLRTFRRKLASTDPISSDVLAELDQELRLTSLALGDRAKQSKAMNDVTLNGILDQYSNRLISMLDEKLRLSGHIVDKPPSDEDSSKRPNSSGTSSSSATELV